MLQQIKLGLGTVQFGMQYGIANSTGKTSSGEVSKILSLALQNGIDTLDTASAYGDAEKVLGEVDVNDFKVISKFLPANAEKEMAFQFEQSIKYLNVKKLYGYLAHRPMELINNYWQWEFLLQKKAQGVVDKIGFSLNEPAELNTLLDKNILPDLIQVPFNFLDRRFEKQLIELKNKGVEIHTRSAFLQGLFFTDEKSLPSFFDEVKPTITEFKKQNNDTAKALLNFVLQKNFIDKVIVGVETAAQLQTNIKAASGSNETIEMELPLIDEKILMPANWPKL